MADVNTTAWNYKDLLKKLEDAGSPVLKEGAAELVGAVFDWAQESIIESENKYDDFALSFLPFAKTYLLKLINKIPGGESDKLKTAMNEAQDQSDRLAANPVQSLPMA